MGVNIYIKSESPLGSANEWSQDYDKNTIRDDNWRWFIIDESDESVIFESQRFKSANDATSNILYAHALMSIYFLSMSKTLDENLIVPNASVRVEPIPDLKEIRYSWSVRAESATPSRRYYMVLEANGRGDKPGFPDRRSAIQDMARVYSYLSVFLIRAAALARTTQCSDLIKK